MFCGDALSWSYFWRHLPADDQLGGLGTWRRWPTGYAGWLRPLDLDGGLDYAHRCSVAARWARDCLRGTLRVWVHARRGVNMTMPAWTMGGDSRRALSPAPWGVEAGSLKLSSARKSDVHAEPGERFGCWHIKLSDHLPEWANASATSRPPSCMVAYQPPSLSNEYSGQTAAYNRSVRSGITALPAPASAARACGLLVSSSQLLRHRAWSWSRAGLLRLQVGRAGTVRIHVSWCVALHLSSGRADKCSARYW